MVVTLQVTALVQACHVPNNAGLKLLLITDY